MDKSTEPVMGVLTKLLYWYVYHPTRHYYAVTLQATFPTVLVQHILFKAYLHEQIIHPEFPWPVPGE